MDDPQGARHRAQARSRIAVLPRVSTLRLVGPAAEHARGRMLLPLGATLEEGAPTWAVALSPASATDVDAIARALPDPDELPPETLLIVLSAVVDPPSFGSRFLAALGR